MFKNIGRNTLNSCSEVELQNLGKEYGLKIDLTESKTQLKNKYLFIKKSIQGKRDAVWIKYYPNKKEGKCLACSKKIENNFLTDGFCIDLFETNGKLDIENLGLTCRKCHDEISNKGITKYVNSQRKLTSFLKFK